MNLREAAGNALQLLKRAYRFPVMSVGCFLKLVRFLGSGTEKLLMEHCLISNREGLGTSL